MANKAGNIAGASEIAQSLSAVREEIEHLQMVIANVSDAASDVAVMAVGEAEVSSILWTFSHALRMAHKKFDAAFHTLIAIEKQIKAGGGA